MRYYNEKGGDKNRTIPIALYYDKLRKYLKGYRKTQARKRKMGELISTSKEELSFEGFKSLAKLAFLHGPRRSSFHLFLLVAWNLLTRPDNTNDLHVNHINWTLDCLQVVVHCHKGDPTGVIGYKFKHVDSTHG